MSNWTTEKSLQTYNIGKWGEGYFNVSATGHLVVDAANNKPAIDLYRVAELARQSSLSLPLLARFPDILHNRVDELCQAFDGALKRSGQAAHYQPIYPIKVNQNRNVVEELLKTKGGRLGLEAGSKPELLTVLALSSDNGVIICNGYKDRDYIRLALAGTRMGLSVYLVIEKLSELPLILNECRRSGTTPLIGIRLKLASIASGKWQSSGGERSKFGLTASQLPDAIEQLRDAGMLDCLELLHVHLGSQISNIRDIQNGLGETAQFIVQLTKMGIHIRVIDVGGGLGVDYEGTRTRSECSVNYTLAEYADKVVQTLASTCAQFKIKMPDIFSESGRALTAHHAVLITNVTEVEKHDFEIPAEGVNEAGFLQELYNQLNALQLDKPIHEIYHDLGSAMQDIQDRFNQGTLSLDERAKAEQLKYAICYRLHAEIDPANHSQQAIRNELEEILADKVFCNFSIFQSMPDVWGIDQVFPIVPLQRLDEEPDHRAILHDLTCDSDGRIDHYVDQYGIENTLLLHNIKTDEKYLLGFFMLGAYQETLGDIHNLFGDTASANVVHDKDGNITLENIFHGENVSQLLYRVKYDPDQIRQRILDRAQVCHLTDDERGELMEELQASLSAYSYLVD
ncbi:MAG TPA: biosynthetic arginine decarboxylase [Gammaproteobacteria bacterium]|nr:biosynthetic arginine decarboxylase [Gammaproteobacteria bacterium]